MTIRERIGYAALWALPVIVGFGAFMNNDTAPQNEQVGDESSCIGSEHEMSPGVEYKIVRPDMCPDGTEYRVLTSEKSDVEIWTKEEQILMAALGSTVTKTGDGYAIRGP